MAKKKSAQFKRFASAMSKIVVVSKDELAKRERADKAARVLKKSAKSIQSDRATPIASDTLD